MLPSLDSGEKPREDGKSVIDQGKSGIMQLRYRWKRSRRKIFRIRVALVEAGVGVGLATGFIVIAVLLVERKVFVVFIGGAVGGDLVLDYALTLVNDVLQR
jgi:hypothetical protein